MNKTTRIASLMALVILSVLNYAVYEKERILAHGNRLLLELQPVDPRSLMQGDYMRLRYRLADNLPADGLAVNGYVLVRPDADQVGASIRIDDGYSAQPEEVKIRYHRKGNMATLRPDSYLFQEGQAGRYSSARYGIFAYDAAGNALLVGLADSQKRPILAKE